MNSKEIQAKIADLREQYITAARTEMTEGFKNLFMLYPDIESISWTQYTPYFNDGDECTFSVHDITRVNGEDRYDLKTLNKTIWCNNTSKPNPHYDEKMHNAVNRFDSLINSFGDDVMRDIFGDHVEVTATIKGFETEDYKHE